MLSELKSKRFILYLCLSLKSASGESGDGTSNVPSNPFGVLNHHLIHTCLQPVELFSMRRDVSFFCTLSSSLAVPCVDFSCLLTTFKSASLQAQLGGFWRFMERLWRRWCLLSLSLKRYLLGIRSTKIPGHV